MMNDKILSIEIFKPFETCGMRAPEAAPLASDETNGVFEDELAEFEFPVVDVASMIDFNYSSSQSKI